jgi:hypothetical protein
VILIANKKSHKQNYVKKSQFSSPPPYPKEFCPSQFFYMQDRDETYIKGSEED